MESDGNGPNIDFSDPDDIHESVRSALMDLSPSSGAASWESADPTGSDSAQLWNMGHLMRTAQLATDRRDEYNTTFSFLHELTSKDSLGSDVPGVTEGLTTPPSSADPLQNSADSVAPTATGPSGLGVGMRAKITSDGYTVPILGPYRFNGSSYGWRIHPTRGGRRFHKGIDLPGAKGLPLLAVENCKIVAMMDGGFGNGLMLQSLRRRNVYYVYGHCNAYASGIKVGMNVRVADIVAFLGTTGQSTGPHLHFEIRSSPQGGQTNPKPFMVRWRAATMTLTEYLNQSSATAASPVATPRPPSSGNHGGNQL